MNGTATRVRIHPMERFHLNDVRRVDELVYTKPWSLAMFRQELDKRDSRHYVVAQIDGRHAGHAGLLQIADEGHVTTVAVDPQWQRHGVGACLMLDLHRHAIGRGVQAMTLEVRVSNAPAIGLYRRFGYAPAGVRKNYYSDEGEDGLVMWAHDIQVPAHRERLDTIEAEVLAR
jgi:[ribosomal protein S18]-alanine N-acetyltransferase